MRSPFPSLDVVVPVFNEESVLPLLFDRLRSVFSDSVLKKAGISSVRFIFVDDGSRDKSARLISDAIADGLSARLVRFSRNFGHQNAVAAGISRCHAEMVAIIDADLQDPPEVILEMVDLWRENYDVVCGVRRKRKEGPLKKFFYWSYYRILAFLSEVEVVKDSGDFCLMDRRVIQALNALPEKVRFNRGLRTWVGFRQTSLEYERDRRCAGDSKYSFRDLYRLGTEGIVSSGTRPLKVVQLGAFLVGLLVIAFGSYSVFLISSGNVSREVVLISIGYTVTGFTSLVTLLALHLIAGYLGRTYTEVKSRPAYLVWEEIESVGIALSEVPAVPARTIPIEAGQC